MSKISWARRFMAPDTTGSRKIFGAASGVLGTALIICSFAAFAWVAADAIRSVDGLVPARWTPLAGAIALQFTMLFGLMVIWERVLIVVWALDRDSKPPPKPQLYTSYSRSWLARYIPGRIWSLAGRAVIANKAGVPPDVVARSMVIEVIFTYGLITILSVAFLSAVNIHLLAGPAALVIGLAIFIAGLVNLQKIVVTRQPDNHQCSFWGKTFNRAAQLITGGSALTRSNTLWGVSVYGLYSCMHLGFIVLISAAFADLDISLAATLAGAWGLSVTLGWISFLAPAGLGVRDGLAFVLFSQVLDPATAGIIVTTSRVVMVATDAAFVGAVELFALGRTRGQLS